jgi:uncharacterized surface protein with fasciclin (FAS1) repeats
MTIASLKVHCLIGLLAVAVGGCKEKPDTAPPEPAIEAPDAEDKADGCVTRRRRRRTTRTRPTRRRRRIRRPTRSRSRRPSGGDVIAVLAANPKTKTFSELLPLSDYGKGMHGLEGSGFTVLAPSDDAFAKLPKGTLDRLKKKPAELDDLIRHHVVLGKNDVNKLTGFRTAPTAAGRDLEVKTQDNDVTIQGAKLVEMDLMATNGVVHVIDRVIKK